MQQEDDLKLFLSCLLHMCTDFCLSGLLFSSIPQHIQIVNSFFLILQKKCDIKHPQIEVPNSLPALTVSIVHMRF